MRNVSRDARAFAVLKRVFDASHMLVTTVDRVRVLLVFGLLCFDLLRLRGMLIARAIDPVGEMGSESMRGRVMQAGLWVSGVMRGWLTGGLKASRGVLGSSFPRPMGYLVSMAS